MGLDCKNFRDLIVIPTLKELAPEFSFQNVAVNLVMETIYHESQQLTYLVQMPNYGPAHGLLQMEEETWDWLVDDFLPKHKSWPKFAKISPNHPKIPYEELHWNLKLNVAMCRARYAASSSPLPNDTLESRSDYWFTVYNASGVTIRKYHYETDAKNLDKLLL